MKTLEQIRKDLKQIQDAFRYGLKREQFGCVSYPKNFQTMAESVPDRLGASPETAENGIRRIVR